MTRIVIKGARIDQQFWILQNIWVMVVWIAILEVNLDAVKGALPGTRE